MNIFEANPSLNSYVAKYMDEFGVNFTSACEDLGINPNEEIETNQFD